MADAAENRLIDRNVPEFMRGMARPKLAGFLKRQNDIETYGFVGAKTWRTLTRHGVLTTIVVIFLLVGGVVLAATSAIEYFRRNPQSRVFAMCTAVTIGVMVAVHQMIVRYRRVLLKGLADDRYWDGVLSFLMRFPLLSSNLQLIQDSAVTWAIEPFSSISERISETRYKKFLQAAEDTQPVDCESSPGTVWSPCSSACDGGTRTRMPIVKQQPNEKGKKCPPPEIQSCNAGVPCPVDCNFTWSPVWSPCDAKCGVGRQSRVAVITRQAAYGGAECPTTQDRNCPDLKPCKINCQFTWNDWSPCSKPCGGGAMRRSANILMRPEGGGQPCPADQDASCNTDSCPKDCQVTWGPWSSCDVSTGTRSRQPTVVVPAEGDGAECPGAQTEKCPVDCKYTYAPWSDCEGDCGQGIQYQEVVVQTPAMNGGAECPPTKTQQCQLEKSCCEYDELPAEVARCPVFCGGAQTKVIKKAVAYGGATQCVDKESKVDCNPQDCPPIPPIVQSLVAYYSGESLDVTNADFPVWRNSVNDRPENDAIIYTGEKGSGALKYLKAGRRVVLRGNTQTAIAFPTAMLSHGNYTLFHVAGYASTATAQTKQRILTADTSSEWFSGFSKGQVGVACHGDFLTAEDFTIPVWASPSLAVSTDQTAVYRVNGWQTSYPGVAGRLTPSNLFVNKYSNEASDFDIGCLLVYNTELSESDILLVEAWLALQYQGAAVCHSSIRRPTAQMQLSQVLRPDGIQRLINGVYIAEFLDSGRSIQVKQKRQDGSDQVVWRSTNTSGIGRLVADVSGELSVITNAGVAEWQSGVTPAGKAPPPVLSLRLGPDGILAWNGKEFSTTYVRTSNDPTMDVPLMKTDDPYKYAVTSVNQKFRFVLQSDGRVVVQNLTRSTPIAVWTMPSKDPTNIPMVAYEARATTDGRFVVVNVTMNREVWAAPAKMTPPIGVAINDDGTVDMCSGQDKVKIIKPDIPDIPADVFAPARVTQADPIFTDQETSGCSDTSLSLSCPAGGTIDSGSYRYGRWDNTVCLNSTVTASTPPQWQDVPLPSAAVGQSAYTLTVPGAVKQQVKAMYKCKSTPTRRNQSKVATGCENGTVYLGCGGGRISGGEVKYGRWDNGVCPDPSVKRDTAAYFRIYDLPADAIGRGFYPLTKPSDDPYPGVVKHMQVSYNCQGVMPLGRADMPPVTNGLDAFFDGESFDPDYQIWISRVNDCIASLQSGSSPARVVLAPFNKNVVIGDVDCSLQFDYSVWYRGRPYTLFYVAKQRAVRGVIFASEDGAWTSGFAQNASGVAYHGAWITDRKDVHGYDWVIGVDQIDYYRSNGVVRSTTATPGNGTKAPSTMNYPGMPCINRVGDPSGNGEWAVACVLWYNRELTLPEITAVEAFLRSTYDTSVKEMKTSMKTATIIPAVDAPQIPAVPWAFYVADAYDASSTGKKLLDVSGNNRHASVTASAGDDDPRVMTMETSGRKYLAGSSKCYLKVPTPTQQWDDRNYTIFHVARYNGSLRHTIISNIDPSGKNAYPDQQWSSGFWKSKSGYAVHGKLNSFEETDRFGLNWVVSTDQMYVYRGNGVDLMTTSSNYTAAGPGKDSMWIGGSDFGLACLLVYDQVLSKTDILTVERYLRRQYGVTYVADPGANIVAATGSPSAPPTENPVTGGLAAYYTAASLSTNENTWRNVANPKRTFNDRDPYDVDLVSTVSVSQWDPDVVEGRCTDEPIYFPPSLISDAYTLIYVARYRLVVDEATCDIRPSQQGIIFSSRSTSDSPEWVSGFSNGMSGVARHGTWLTQNTTSAHPKFAWVLGVDQPRLFRSNGVTRVKNIVTDADMRLPAILSINGCNKSGRSDFELKCILVYSRELSLKEIGVVERWLSRVHRVPVETQQSLLDVSRTIASPTQNYELRVSNGDLELVSSGRRLWRTGMFASDAVTATDAIVSLGLSSNFQEIATIPDGSSTGVIQVMSASSQPDTAKLAFDGDLSSYWKSAEAYDYRDGTPLATASKTSVPNNVLSGEYIEFGVRKGCYVTPTSYGFRSENSIGKFYFLGYSSVQGWTVLHESQVAQPGGKLITYAISELKSQKFFVAFRLVIASLAKTLTYAGIGSLSVTGTLSRNTDIIQNASAARLLLADEYRQFEPTLADRSSILFAGDLPVQCNIVRLRRNDGSDTIVNLRHIKVYDENDAQIKRGVTASASSSWDAATGAWAPANMLDDKDDTLTATMPEKNAWLQLDLGSSRSVSRVHAGNRLDGEKGRMVGTVLELVSNGVVVFQSAISDIKDDYMISTIQAPPDGLTVKIDKKPIECRYITIRRADNVDNYINLRSIRVFDASGVEIRLDPSWVSASNIFNNDVNSFGPQLLVDGLDSTFLHTTGDKNAFVRVDLKSPRYVSRVQVGNRLDVQDRILGTVLELGDADAATVFQYTFNTTSPDYSVQTLRVADNAASVRLQDRSIPCRYIKISHDRKRILNISSVKIFDETGTRITDNLKAESSGVWDNNPGAWGPDNMLDDNDASIAATMNEPNPYLRVDLGSVRKVSRVIIINRPDCCRFRLVGALVELIDQSGRSYSYQIDEEKYEYVIDTLYVPYTFPLQLSVSDEGRVALMDSVGTSVRTLQGASFPPVARDPLYGARLVACFRGECYNPSMCEPGDRCVWPNMVQLETLAVPDAVSGALAGEAPRKIFAPSKAYAYIRGGPQHSFWFQNIFRRRYYTLFHVARYGARSAKNGRIFTSSKTAYGDWVSGFYDESVGVARSGGVWITKQTGSVDTGEWVITMHSRGYAYKYVPDTATGANMKVELAYGRLRVNRRDVAINSQPLDNSLEPSGFSINGYSGEESAWEVACVLAYDHELSQESIESIEDYLFQTYSPDSVQYQRLLGQTDKIKSPKGEFSVMLDGAGSLVQAMNLGMFGEKVMGSTRTDNRGVAALWGRKSSRDVTVFLGTTQDLPPVMRWVLYPLPSNAISTTGSFSITVDSQGSAVIQYAGNPDLVLTISLIGTALPPTLTLSRALDGNLPVSTIIVRRTDNRILGLKLSKIMVFGADNKLIDMSAFNQPAISPLTSMSGSPQSIIDYDTVSESATGDSASAHIKLLFQGNAERLISSVVVTTASASTNALVGCSLQMFRTDGTIVYNRPIVEPASEYRFSPEPRVRASRVRVERTDGNPTSLNLSEIQVYDGDGLPVPASQLSASIFPTYSADYGANRLIDGTHNIALTKASPDAYMEVYLDRAPDISAVVVVNRRDCCQESMIGTRIILTDAGGDVLVEQRVSEARAEYVLILRKYVPLKRYAIANFYQPIKTAADLTSQPMTGSLQQCAASCNNDPVCAGFARTKGAAANDATAQCYLQSSFPAPQPVSSVWDTWLRY